MNTKKRTKAKVKKVCCSGPHCMEYLPSIPVIDTNTNLAYCTKECLEETIAVYTIRIMKPS